MSSHSKFGVRAFQLTKAGAIHSSPTDIANEAASALAGAPTGATFVTMKTAAGRLEHSFVTEDAQNQESVAFALAQAMNSRSTEVDDVPDLVAAGGFANIGIARGARPMMDTQAGADFTTLSRIVANLLMEGEWVAMSIRKPAQYRESRKYARWLDHHAMRTHHSRLPGAVVMSLYAGGRDPDRAADIVSRVASGIPGFGLNVVPRKITVAREILRWVAGAGLSLAIGFLTMLLHIALPLWLPLAAAAVFAAGALGTWKLILPSELRTLIGELKWGFVPAAPKRAAPARKPRAEKQRTNKDGEQYTQAEFGGDYPLAPTSFLVGPHIPLALIAPHSGASGGATTAARPAPSCMRDRIGPPIGINDDQLVHLDAGAAYAGLAVLGQAGSGKTALLEHLWGAASRERVRPSGVPGAPARHAMVAFDTKGDGLASAQYERWLDYNQDPQKTIIHVLDPSCPIGIDLFPVLPGEGVDAWARKVVAALVYIWGEVSIGPRSFDTLTRVLEAGLALAHSPEIAQSVTLAPVRLGASPFYYADILLTNSGDALGVELAAAIKNAGADPHNAAAASFAYISGRLAPLYGDGKTPAQRGQLVDAPRTKIAALMGVEHWWSRGIRYTWPQLLEADVAVVLNTGIGPSGMLPDDKLREDMSGLLLYTLREDIRRTCVGWFEQNRAVSIFADEVKHIANTNDRVIRALRDDDRALGVRCVFATQTPETLAQEVRRTFLGFGSLVIFRQEEANTVAELVRDLVQSGDTWEPGDIVNLPQFHAIVRATAGGRRNDPFTIQVPNWRQQRDELVWTT
ncbi:hypothetical protein HMPREF1529_02135 [Microbacterium sp. oral taxon 186 str. F0373]|nr:hypothetical protein [Microbacterium sp. oral taxon 186]EPD84095.1 hypothetical protein HMPREF1529_02135 [Microbacterium sp. oral taxon 186 str. F0373]